MAINHLALTLIVAAPLALCGCARHSASSVSGPELAARVNQQAISAREVDRSTAGYTDHAALEALIDQTLLVQEARRLGLDANPALRSSIAAAARTLLAQAYLDSAAARSAAPDEEAVARYYREHPELFAHRRLYLLRELEVTLLPERSSELARHSAAGDLSSLEHWLSASHIAFHVRNSARSSDELPREFVSAMARLRTGDIGIAHRPQGAWVVQVLASVPQPLSEDEAKPVIALYLEHRQREAIARAEVQRLRDAAHIEYLGRYGPHIPAHATDTAMALLR